MKIDHCALRLYGVLLIAVVISATGCSTTQMRQAWERTKTASVNAAVDPMTWGAALGAAALYITDGDDGLTDYFVDNNWVDNDLDAVLLDTNAAIALVTAVTVPDEDVRTKAKRAAVTLGAFGVSRLTANALEDNVSKEAPDGSDDALGSHHAVEPFSGAAATRRHVAAMNLPTWASVSIIGASYTTASLAALTRVQEEGHSFGDQLVNAAIGNFIGIFLVDAFMLENTTVDVGLAGDHAYLGFRMAF